MSWRRHAGVFLFFAVVFSKLALSAQQACPVPPEITPPSPQLNIFSDSQEADLGDLMSESVEQNITVLDDAALNEHLRQVGNRLVRCLPENNFRFQFVLVDIADANAFSLPGGKVYVSRKLVAFSRNDNEL